MNSKYLTNCTVQDIAATQKNALVGGPFGSNLVSSDYVQDGVPVIRGANMGLGRWVSGEFAFVTKEKAESLSANIARPGDLVFTQRGTIGQVAIIPEDGYEEYLISQSQMKLTVDETKADVKFLYYLFNSDEQLAYIRQNAIQTGVPHTNLTILRKTPLRLPEPTAQRAIAKILSAFDDKIELNRRMNATLEAMARALFKAWFVDFEPVHANLENRPSTSASPEIAKLFPSDFENGIPKGWHVRKLEDVVELAYGKALTADNRVPGDVPVYGSNGPVGFHNEALVDGPGIVVGRKGNPGTVIWVDDGFFPIDTTFYVKSDIDLRFVFHSLENLDLPNLGGDSAVPGLSRSIAYRESVLVPSAEIVEIFREVSQPFIVKICANTLESKLLSEIRDTLLPRLISGKLRLCDEEKQECIGNVLTSFKHLRNVEECQPIG